MPEIKKDMLITGFIALLTSLALAGAGITSFRGGGLLEKKRTAISCGLDWSGVSNVTGNQNSNDPGRENRHPGQNEGNGCSHQLAAGLLLPNRGKNRSGRLFYCS